MAIKHIPLSLNERAMCGGFTDLYVVGYADMTKNATTSITLETPAAGDIIHSAFLDPVTAVAGPATATASLGITGTTDAFVAAASDLKATTPIAAIASATPQVMDGSKSLLLTTVIANATLTAGETRVFARISRRATRSVAA